MHLATAAKYIRRSPYQSIITVAILTLMLYISSIFFILAFESHVVLKYFETRPQIIAFFKDKTSVKDIDKLKKVLNDTKKIASLKFISKEEALAIYKEQNKKDPLLLEMVSADILPSSLEVSAINASDLKELSDLVKKQKIVEEVNFQKDIVDQLIYWTNGIRKTGIEFLIILSLASTLVILTVISLKIAIRREEIDILRLLGATNWYIRWPFLFEGIFYGFVSSFFAWIFIILRIWQIKPVFDILSSNIPPLAQPSLILFVLLFGVMSSYGVLVGIIGSLLAVKRYLK